MKKVIFFSLVVFCILFSCSNKKDFSGIKDGMTIEEVIKMVGEPQETLEMMPGIQWLKYKEGHLVIVEDGIVVNSVSQEQFEKGIQEFNDSIQMLLETFE